MGRRKTRTHFSQICNKGNNGRATFPCARAVMLNGGRARATMDLTTVNVIDAFSVVQKREKGETRGRERRPHTAITRPTTFGAASSLYLQTCSRRLDRGGRYYLYQGEISWDRLDSDSPRSIRAKMSRNVPDLLSTFLPHSARTHCSAQIPGASERASTFLALHSFCMFANASERELSGGGERERLGGGHSVQFSTEEMIGGGAPSSLPPLLP